MNEKNLVEYKKKYHRYRHHAWAGLGFLSVFLAVRLILGIKAPDILDPIIFVVILYIVIALLFTYRFRAGLSAEDTIKTVEQPNVEIEKARINAEVEKERLKVEKKKAKAETKAKKKAKK